MFTNILWSFRWNRNICFNAKGDKFLTTSYDSWIKLYDTETVKI